MIEITPERITIISGLLAIIATGARKIWVWGYQLTETEARRVTDLAASDSRTKAAEDRARRWEDIALKALSVGEKVVAKAEVKNGDG